MNLNDPKKIAAEKAVEEIKDDMIVGLGTGSTFHFALLKIAERIQSGELKNIKCVASSKQTELKAAELGIPLVTLNELYKSGRRTSSQSATKTADKFSIDLTIDGADELDKDLNLIKGGGGALLREKVIVQASKKFIVVVDESKLSKKLGMNFPVPVEVLQFAVEAEKSFLESLGANVSIRKNSDGEHFITDEGNFILDAKINAIENVDEFASILEQRAGIVEHGLFRSCLVSKVVCSFSDGSVTEWNSYKL
ncbi:MAG: ribose 5-phosphate isomerase [Ignavibacteria bacterium]|nr:MAG: ribose 5-phosphate isomerase [Ignavibacteria bacterium]KAF0160978.1 MAG: ribose 5-phosphate isomerase [Ignavibacteria bacterium]